MGDMVELPIQASVGTAPRNGVGLGAAYFPGGHIFILIGFCSWP